MTEERERPKELTDAELAEVVQRRMQARIQRVVQVMEEVGLDIAADAIILPDGRLGARPRWVDAPRQSPVVRSPVAAGPPQREDGKECST
jgi:transposase